MENAKIYYTVYTSDKAKALKLALIQIKFSAQGVLTF